MAAHEGYNLIDGLYGTAPKRIIKRTVWADAATYTAGQVLVVNAGGTPGTGHIRTFKKCDADDVGPYGVVCAEGKTLPTGGGTIEVLAGGTIDGATYGLASAAAIAAGERVTSSVTSGKIKKVTTTPDEPNQSYGTCVVAFGGADTTGTVEWEPCPIL